MTEFGASWARSIMSPEQAELNQLDIDTRIRRLQPGVLFYEC